MYRLSTHRDYGDMHWVALRAVDASDRWVLVTTFGRAPEFDPAREYSLEEIRELADAADRDGNAQVQERGSRPT